MAFKKRFKISDESVNTYGFWVRTDGIRLGNAQANCPAFFNHRTGDLPLGHWEDIKPEGNGELWATLVIEGESDEERTYIRKIENKDIRSASMGLDVITWNDDKLNIKDGQKIATLWDSELFEISIAPLPSNKNALALRNTSGIINLSDSATLITLPNIQPHTMDYKKQLTQSLSLPDNATDEQIQQALSNKPKEKTELEKLVDTAIELRRIGDHERDFFLKMGKLDFAATKAHLEDLKVKIKVTDLIRRGSGDVVTDAGQDRSKWSLHDYRKHDPDALKKDPELYQKLINEDRQKAHL